MVFREPRLRMLTDAGSGAARRLAVWGDPIGHSRSPDLHRAAYRVLGLDWTYDRSRVEAARFEDTVAGLGTEWHGLSLTMPLKEEAFRWARARDRHSELTGAVNTLVLDGEQRGHGWNTDVGGLVRALSEAGLADARSVRILGAGATTASAIVAAAELGAEQVEVRARRPETIPPLARIAASLGLPLAGRGFSEAAGVVDVTVSALPGGTVLPDAVAGPLAARGGTLFDVAYSPWPSALAQAWGEGHAVPGLAMLLHQAVLQVRIFLHGDVGVPLPAEEKVVAAMRHALMGD